MIDKYLYVDDGGSFDVLIDREKGTIKLKYSEQDLWSPLFRGETAAKLKDTGDAVTITLEQDIKIKNIHYDNLRNLYLLLMAFFEDEGLDGVSSPVMRYKLKDVPSTQLRGQNMDQDKGSFFPAVIKYTDNDDVVKVESPKLIESGRPFIVLETFSDDE